MHTFVKQDKREPDIFNRKADSLWYLSCTGLVSIAGGKNWEGAGGWGGILIGESENIVCLLLPRATSGDQRVVFIDHWH